MKISENDKLTFSSAVFYNFYKNIPRASCIMVDMLEDDLLDLDGDINTYNIDRIREEDLWLYIYYLWKHNNDINDDGVSSNGPNSNANSPLFNKMTSGHNKASATLFIRTILEYMMMKKLANNIIDDTKTTLINFLSDIAQDKKWTSIRIPVFNSIYSSVIRKLKTSDGNDNVGEYNDNEDNNEGNNEGNSKGQLNIRLVADINDNGSVILRDV